MLLRSSQDHCKKLLDELAKVAAHFNFGSLGATAGPDDIEMIAVAAK